MSERIAAILPPEGLGLVLAPTGPFFMPRRLRTFVPFTMRISVIVSLGLCCLSACGCDGTSGAGDKAAPPPAITSTKESPRASEPRTLKLTDDLIVHLNAPGGSYVEIHGQTCLDEGYLEQVACSPRTREHESLVVIRTEPSKIHTALLTAGFESGKPGEWIYEDGKVSTRNPTGEKLDVLVSYIDKEGKKIERPVRDWIRRHAREADAPGTDRSFPKVPWVFGGSRFAPNTPQMGPGEHYVADMTGSIIGLVTFGDEVIGLSIVMSDQAEIQPQEWEVNTDLVPAMETPVTLIVRKWKK